MAGETTAVREVGEVFDGFVRHLVAASPTAATRFGDHTRDADLDDWSPGEADRRIRVLGDLRRRLDAVDGADDREATGDAALLAATLDAERFELEELRAAEMDPALYLGLATGGVHDLLRRDDLPPEPRRTAAAARAAQVPRLLEQARRNLDGIPGPHRDVALRRVPGAAALFRDVLPAFAPDAGDAGEAAAAACERFGAWLEDGGDDPGPDWRLGEARWNDALRIMLGVDMPGSEVWRRAQYRLSELTSLTEHLAADVLGRDADGLEGEEMVRRALDRASADRSPRHALVADAAGVLDGIRAFLRDEGSFELPEPDRLRVEEVPPFLQGYAVAFFVPPPALEPGAAATYYLSPVPDDWDDARADSFLREYNVHALRSVGIHEAYPGHHVQLAFAQRHPRLIRRALWNPAFVEGWAIYVERRVIAAGFCEEDAASAARLRLVSAKMEMRSVANALLDQGLHVRQMSEPEAVALMVDETFQEPAEAQGKLLRGQISAGQLSTYFVGGEEMDDLRLDAERAGMAPADFHRRVLAQGSPPFPVLRRALLGEEVA